MTLWHRSVLGAFVRTAVSSCEARQSCYSLVCRLVSFIFGVPPENVHSQRFESEAKALHETQHIYHPSVLLVFMKISFELSFVASFLMLLLLLFDGSISY